MNCILFWVDVIRSHFGNYAEPHVALEPQVGDPLAVVQVIAGCFTEVGSYSGINKYLTLC